MDHAYPFEIDTQDADAVIDAFHRGAEACRQATCRTGCVERIEGRGTLAATGDLHDNPFHLDKVLRFARLDASPDHHVTFHELIHGEHLMNGMDFSYRMLVRMAELKIRFPEQVHMLLANHELSQMRGTAVGKGAGDSVAAFLDALDFVFHDRAEDVDVALRAFLRAWPIALITSNGLWCSHSLPGERVMKVFDPDVITRDLTDEDYTASTGSAYMMLWGRRHSAEHLDRLAETLGVKAFILGHEHAETGWMPVGRNALVLNSDHERGVVLRVDLSEPPDRDSWMYAVTPLHAL